MFFFFKEKTAYYVRISDWSSDVCSSDLDGARLEGVERFRMVGPRKAVPQSFAVRFHLHPDVRAARTGEGRSVILRLPSGLAWTFDADAIGRASCRAGVCQ